jgi:hypothetical protein
LKRGASATAAASPVRAVPVTKLMSLASLLLRIKTGLWREHTGARRVGLSAHGLNGAKKPVYLRFLV